MKITIKRGECGTCRLEAEDGRDILAQSDTELPGIASTFECAHRTASDMIAVAQKFLDDHIGDRADDPGYFEGDLEGYDAEHDADRLLAQQELEDFERADEYFGHGDDGF